MSFKDEATKLLLARGVATEEGDWTYGWRGFYSPSDDGHSAGCHWVSTDESEIVEYSFSEFEDTFSGNTNKVVLSLTHVNCQCRKLKDVTLGIEGGAIKILHELLGVKIEYRY